jgi:membrane protease YdiL (CAAX protease family)
MSATGDEQEPSSPAPSSLAASPAAKREAIVTAIAVTAVALVVLTYAFDAERAGQSSMLAAVGGLYAVLGAVTLRRLRQRGELASSFFPARGDITFAAVTAGVLYGGSRIAASIFATHGSPRELWVMRLYLQLGAMPEHKLLGLTVAIVAALEELAWRGLVMRALQEVTTDLRAAVATTLLYTLAHATTVVLLRMPGAGPNPLVALAALGTGFVFALLTVRTGRLTPAILAHALFSWSVVEFPLWQPSGLF